MHRKTLPKQKERKHTGHEHPGSGVKTMGRSYGTGAELRTFIVAFLTLKQPLKTSAPIFHKKLGFALLTCNLTLSIA